MRIPLFCCVASIVVIILSCDQPRFLVESETKTLEPNIFTVSDNITIDSLFFEVLTFSNDSVLSVKYIREDTSSGSIPIETFSISLNNKLNDSSLNYGNNAMIRYYKAAVDTLQLIPFQGFRFLYEYRNTQFDRNIPPIVSETFHYDNLIFKSSGSPIIMDFTYKLNAPLYNRISNLVIFQTKQVEIYFHRELTRGSIVTIGNTYKRLFYHFKLLRPISKLIIPAYLSEEIYEGNENANYIIMFTEGIFLGSLYSTDKTNQKSYNVPIYLTSIGSRTIEFVE